MCFFLRGIAPALPSLDRLVKIGAVKQRRPRYSTGRAIRRDWHRDDFPACLNSSSIAGLIDKYAAAMRRSYSRGTTSGRTATGSAWDFFFWRGKTQLQLNPEFTAFWVAGAGRGRDCRTLVAASNGP
jgi:hypothetical protein